jgi:hypothetical protein
MRPGIHVCSFPPILIGVAVAFDAHDYWGARTRPATKMPKSSPRSIKNNL